MAFETRKSGDPATAKAPRRRAAAAAVEPAVEAALPVSTPAVEAAPPVSTPAAEAPVAASVFGSTRPKRVRMPVAEDLPVAAPTDVAPATDSGGFAARGAGRRRAASSTVTTDSPAAPASVEAHESPSAATTAAVIPAPRTTVPSVEEPATLLRDDRILQPPTEREARVGKPAAQADAAVHASPKPGGGAAVTAIDRDATEPEPELDATHEAVVVTLGGGRYGVAMDAVDEVGRPPAVTRVPGLPAWLAGVANWRGRVLAVLDLRPLLAAAQVPLGRNGRLVVCSIDGVTVGLLTEDVEGVVTVERAAVEQPLVTLAGQAALLVAGQIRHERGPIALLDLDAVFALRGQLPRARRAG